MTTTTFSDRQIVEELAGMVEGDESGRPGPRFPDVTVQLSGEDGNAPA